MSAFTGPQGRGALRAHRAQKREEAEARNAVTHPDDRRVTREGAVEQRRANRRTGATS